MREPDAPAEPEDEPGASADIPANLEHELANALASIVGFSQVIRRDPSLPEDLRRSAELLAEEVARTRRLVGDLVGFARQGLSERHSADAAAPHGAGDAGFTESMAGSARPRVLVLDNEPSIRVFLEKALEALGYEPVIAETGSDAVRLSTIGEHAAVLCDHQMPGMSGAEAYDAIVVARPELATRFVMMSGDLHDNAIEAFATTRPVTLLVKPFDLDTLDRTIRAVMEATGQSRG